MRFALTLGLSVFGVQLVAPGVDGFGQYRVAHFTGGGMHHVAAVAANVRSDKVPRVLIAATAKIIGCQGLSFPRAHDVYARTEPIKVRDFLELCGCPATLFNKVVARADLFTLRGERGDIIAKSGNDKHGGFSVRLRDSADYSRLVCERWHTHRKIKSAPG